MIEPRSKPTGPRGCVLRPRERVTEMNWNKFWDAAVLPLGAVLAVSAMFVGMLLLGMFA